MPISEKKSKSKAIFDFMSACFVPLTPALAGAGMLKGLVILASTYGGLDKSTGLYTILDAGADAVFYFMPVMLGYLAAKRLGTNEILAMTLAGILLYPTIVSAAGTVSTFLGIPFAMVKYSSSVLPILLSVFLMQYVYRFFMRIIPDALRIILVPMLTLAVMAPIALVLLGPIGYYVGIWLGTAIKALFDFSPLLAGIVVGGTRQFVVFAGMHMSLTPIMLNNIGTLGYDMIAPVNCVATMACAGMCFGTFLRAKQTDTKASAGSAFISAFIGITTPALYSVGLRFRKPMLGTIIGGAVSGGFVAAAGGKALSFAMPSVISLPVYAGTIPVMLTGLAISFIVSAAVSYAAGLDETIEADEKALAAEKKNIHFGKKAK